MFNSDQRGQPSWRTALLIFLALIVVIQVMSHRTGSETALQRHFAANSPAPGTGQITLPAVPTALLERARTTVERLLGGASGQALTPVGQNQALRVEITALEPQDGHLRVRGTVTNISAAPLELSLDAFKFSDERGTTYASHGSPSTALPPHQPVPLDITLPVDHPRFLRLQITSPGLDTIDMVLINAAPTPTP
ncbi:hypothetical protein [Kallotenue papyrolyticum]|uniref:hypothetical protein n=1 Tax=Kallotenue papyrolyticum TaxID=1325125 RepID=UPI0004786026|nr:hypothetical protein [Kallotenue papyrolyticum]